MYGKILIESKLRVVTGMHIGGSSVFSAIGAVDSPVIKDSHTNRPIVPGSSLKGKLRALLALTANTTDARDFNDDNELVLRLFGSSRPVRKSRLQFADAFVLNAKQFAETGLTEVKFENGIDRVTNIANPRQIERVARGVEFGVRIVYNVESGYEEVMEDIKNLTRAMKLLQMDYLGGHGSRGSGRVSFDDFNVEFFECDDAGLDKDAVKALFKEVESYELLPD